MSYPNQIPTYTPQTPNIANPTTNYDLFRNAVPTAPTFPINQPMPRNTSLLRSLFGGGSRSATSLANAATGATTAAKGFSFNGLLNGASKTLGVINQAIPVIYQVKPIWNNAKTMFRVMKAVNQNDPSTTTTNSTPTVETTNKNPTKTNENENGPTFFA